MNIEEKRGIRKKKKKKKRRQRRGNDNEGNLRHRESEMKIENGGRET